MTRRKGTMPSVSDDVLEALAELFDGGRGGIQLGVGQLELNTFAALADPVLGLGGVVSLWRDNSSGALCLAVRVGEKRRSWDFDTAEQFAAVVPVIAKQFAAAYAKSQHTGKGTTGPAEKRGSRRS